MKTIVAGIVSAALLAGLGGAVVAYRAATLQPSSPTTTSESGRRVADVGGSDRRSGPTTAGAHRQAAGHPRVRVRWAPCVAPATLDRGACVTVVTHTVIVPAAPAPRSVVATVARSHGHHPSRASATSQHQHRDEQGDGQRGHRLGEHSGRRDD